MEMTPSHIHFLTTAQGRKIAYSFEDGKWPAWIFLPGLFADMKGSKVTYLNEVARREGRAFIKFDYSAIGQSPGILADSSFKTWYEDACALIQHFASKSFILIGSSMGAWIGFWLALQHKNQIKGMCTIGAAPDFTKEPRLDILESVPLFSESSKNYYLLDNPIALDIPIRLFHGLQDEVVPWQASLALAERITGQNVTLHLIKDGVHRLARPDDVELLARELIAITP